MKPSWRRSQAETAEGSAPCTSCSPRADVPQLSLNPRLPSVVHGDAVPRVVAVDGVTSDGVRRSRCAGRVRGTVLDAATERVWTLIDGHRSVSAIIDELHEADGGDRPAVATAVYRTLVALVGVGAVDLI